ncbi:MAG: hypothetical protein V2A76_05340 [Planctomycetota bacterium]
MVAAAVVVAAAAFFLLSRDDGGGETGTGSQQTSQSTTGSEKSGQRGPGSSGLQGATPADPKAFAEARRAALADGDAAGREELAAFCMENKMRTTARELRREALLIAPNQEATRTALGFTRYEGPITRYRGRWLSKKDLELARTYEKHAVSGELAGAATSTDVFLRNAEDAKKSMLREFPADRFSYKFGDGTMKQPFLVLIEKAGGNVEKYREEYDNALSTLYEEFYGRYQKRFKMEEIERPATVIVFDSVQTYSAHRDAHPEGNYSDPRFIGGYYQPSSQRLILWRQNDLIGVLLHEGAHMLIHYAFSGRGFEVSNQSPWFQEGFAEFFGGHKEVTKMVNGKQVTRYALGQYLPDRHSTLLLLISMNRAHSLLELVKINDYDFNQAKATMGDEKKSPEEMIAASALVSDIYAQGWAFIVFLNYADGGKYRDAFDAYFEAEVNGSGHYGTLAKLLGITSPEGWEQLDEQFRAWVRLHLKNALAEQNK